MTKARDLANLLDATGDVKSSALDNVPASNDASALTTGTIDNARISLDANEIPNLDTAKITTGTFSDARLPSTALNSNVSVPNQSAFKNIIINGDMSIAQRSTSETGITGAGYKTLDRFRLGGSVPGTWTWSQSTDVPSGQGFAKSMKLECTTTGSAATMYFQHKMEGQNLQYLKKGTSSAESTTLSFWVKSAKTGTYIAMLLDNDNTRHISKSYTISSADTWEKKEITFAGDTSGAFDNDNGASLEIYFWLSANTNNSSGTLATSWASTVSANNAVGQVNLADSTSNNFYITGVQLEAGTSASDFEFLPLDVNLQRCQRYFYVFGDRRTSGAFPIVENRSIGLGVTHYINQCVVSIPMKVNMRTSPSIDQVSGTDFYDYYHGQASDTFDSFNGISSTGEAQQIIRNTNQISASLNDCGIVYINGTDAYTAFDSEL